MERTHQADQFEAFIDESGRIAVPAELRKRFGGRKVQVRLQTREMSAALARNEVTEEELERIAAMQLEPREQVVAFLMTEGELRGNSAFARRAEKLWHKRRRTNR